MAGLLLSACAAFLCYRSVFGLLSAVVILPFYHRMRSAAREQEAEQKLTGEFCSALQIISGALGTGSSLERAFQEAEREMQNDGGDGRMLAGLAAVNRRVRMNEPIEDLFLTFAYDTGVPDICTFAETFRYAKRSGANMPHMIRETVDWLREKERILEDIKTVVTAKRMEQRMLLLLAPGVILFVTVSSPEYADVLYHTLPGALLMTGCLAVYLAAAWWGRKIVSIRV